MKPKIVIMVVLLSAIIMVSCQPTENHQVNSIPTPIPTSFIKTTSPIITATSLQTLNPTELPFDVNVFIRQSVISPSGKWLALVLMTRVNNGRGNKDSFMLTVVNQQNLAERIIEKIDVQRLMGYSIPWALAWSEKEDYLYYTHRFGGSEGCFNDNDFFGTDLFKVNLDSGKSFQLTPNLGYWLALSPNQTSVAYLTRDNTLKIRNIETGEEKETFINEQIKYPDTILTRASHLIWSPNGKELLLVLEINVCAMEEDAKNSIIKVNATTLSQDVLVQDDSSRPITLEWPNDGMVLVQDKNRLYWFLNPSNGQMTERK